jgi:beta-N-acetylhexosaminidase
VVRFRSVALVLAASLSMLAAVPQAIAQSLEEMAGQMIIVGFQGTSVKDKSVQALIDQIEAGQLGGIMYLKTNVTSLDNVKAMNDAFRAASPQYLPFITIDQEGGYVERLTKDVGFTEVPTPAEVATKMDQGEATTLYRGMAKRLAALGFTVNFGPVADVNINTKNPIIAKFGRAFSADPAQVVAFDQAFIKAHEEEGVLTSLKHYPGHGSSTGDSHEGFVDISKTWKEMKEMLPFNVLIGSGYDDMIMVGHLYHEDFSGKDGKLPASLSAGWIRDTLRAKGGYEGVVITDDLEMGAIRKLFTTEETVKLAVMAGVDVLLFSNTADYTPSLAAKIRDIIIKEAKADPAFRQRVEESFKRVRKLKLRLKLIQDIASR